MAVRTRSLDSFTAASGSPTITKDVFSQAKEASTSTSTNRASIPRRTIERIRDKAINSLFDIYNEIRRKSKMIVIARSRFECNYLPNSILQVHLCAIQVCDRKVGILRN